MMVLRSSPGASSLPRQKVRTTASRSSGLRLLFTVASGICRATYSALAEFITRNWQVRLVAAGGLTEVSVSSNSMTGTFFHSPGPTTPSMVGAAVHGADATTPGRSAAGSGTADRRRATRESRTAFMTVFRVVRVAGAGQDMIE